MVLSSSQTNTYFNFKIKKNCRSNIKWSFLLDYCTSAREIEIFFEIPLPIPWPKWQCTNILTMSNWGDSLSFYWKEAWRLSQVNIWDVSCFLFHLTSSLWCKVVSCDSSSRSAPVTSFVRLSIHQTSLILYLKMFLKVLQEDPRRC